MYQITDFVFFIDHPKLSKINPTQRKMSVNTPNGHEMTAFLLWEKDDDTRIIVAQGRICTTVKQNSCWVIEKTLMDLATVSLK